jgi:excisionase family DNA binding protein
MTTPSHPSFGNRRALSISEAAETLGISHWSIRRLIKSGALRTCRVLRTHLIPIDEIDRLLGNLPSNSKK